MRTLVIYGCFVLNIMKEVVSTAVYMDHYGLCNKHWQTVLNTKTSSENYITVTSDSVTLLAQGSKSASTYYTKTCTVTFKANEETYLCVKFDTFNIPGCGINLKIFDKNTASGEYMKKYSCHDSPESLCSTGKYLTFQLNKPSVSFMRDLEFEINIDETSDADPEDSPFPSMVVIIAIPCGIIVVILVVFLSVKFCCCMKAKARKYEKANQGPNASHSTAQYTVEPTAPPAPEYTEQDLTPYRGGSCQTNNAAFHRNVDSPPEPPPPYTEKSEIMPIV